METLKIFAVILFILVILAFIIFFSIIAYRILFGTNEPISGGIPILDRDRWYEEEVEESVILTEPLVVHTKEHLTERETPTERENRERCKYIHRDWIISAGIKIEKIKSGLRYVVPNGMTSGDMTCFIGKKSEDYHIIWNQALQQKK